VAEGRVRGGEGCIGYRRLPRLEIARQNHLTHKGGSTMRFTSKMTSKRTCVDTNARVRGERGRVMGNAVKHFCTRKCNVMLTPRSPERDLQSRLFLSLPR
jgi:hypothetical protein